MLSAILFLALLLPQQHQHEVKTLKTWDSMKVLAGQVVAVDGDNFTLASADFLSVRVSYFHIDEKSSFVRKPKLKDYCVVIYCPQDLYTYGILLKE